MDEQDESRRYLTKKHIFTTMLQLRGRVITIEDIGKFETKNGEIYQKLIVIEYDDLINDKLHSRSTPFVRKALGEYPKMYCQVGDDVTISFTIESRQNDNMRWYNNLIAHRITKNT